MGEGLLGGGISCEICEVGEKSDWVVKLKVLSLRGLHLGPNVVVGAQISSEQLCYA